MTESTELVTTEQPQALITIEPKKYVELVFEPFAKQYADAVDAVRDVAYDIKTTAGMAVAIKHRAVFRDIRVASEKARKIRKAPIIEIGKLLDSRQGEVEETTLPFETMFDEEIKAEEARKDAEKIAKAVAESARITAIRAKINEIKDCIVVGMGRSSDELESAISELESTEITLEEYGEFSGEAQAAQVDTATKLKVMLTAQLAHEAEAKRLQEEREQLARERAEAAERDRLAAVERAEQEAKDRAERERVEAEQRAAQERAAAAMRAEQQAHEARMAAERAEIQRAQDEINRQREEQERIAQEATEAAEAEAARVAQVEADRIFAEQQRIADEQAAEARRIQAEKDAAEAERQRRERVQFVLNGPGDMEIALTLASHYQVAIGDAMQWLKKFDYEATDEQFSAMNATGNLPHLDQAA